MSESAEFRELARRAHKRAGESGEAAGAVFEAIGAAYELMARAQESLDDRDAGNQADGIS
jgi:hypothetical protein